MVLTTLISGATALGGKSPADGGTLGSISLAATVVTGLSSFLRFGERAERHLAQANLCNALIIEIELFSAVAPPLDRATYYLDSIRERLIALGVDE